MEDPLPPALLLQAYASGIFPMAESRDSAEIRWFEPRRRGLMPLDGFHLSRSLRRRIRRQPFAVALNRDFQATVAACADRPETWINPTILRAYTALHREGFAHSLELREGDELVGGVYGVTLGAAFFGESMFSRRTDASKVALAYLVTHLSACGFRLFDTQFLTPHLASLGGIEVPRDRYRALLADAISRPAEIRARPLPDAYSVIQFNTQTS